jgi:serine/threonine protein phosphatase PrpC
VSESYQIFVKINGKDTSLDVVASNTIADVKEQIEAKEGTPANVQRLQLQTGKPLEDNLTLAQYDIRKDVTISLVIDGRGGCDEGEVFSLAAIFASHLEAHTNKQTNKKQNNTLKPLGRVGVLLRGHRADRKGTGHV